ncbi:MAG: 2Fe-2S iron-sulfur cluster-binding protein [Candidatus Pacearchaeota archaeon]
MPKITNSKTNESREISENSEIKQGCEELGVPFQCTDGICGTCMIDITKGEENLSELTEQEEDLERDKKHRLACQCKIKKGDVEFEL